MIFLERPLSPLSNISARVYMYMIHILSGMCQRDYRCSIHICRYCPHHQHECLNVTCSCILLHCLNIELYGFCIVWNFFSFHTETVTKEMSMLHIKNFLGLFVSLYVYLQRFVSITKFTRWEMFHWQVAFPNDLYNHLKS